MPISGRGRDPRDQTWAGSCIWQDLYDYLRTGESELHGVAAGAMASVVHSGLAKLPDANMQALATYFADINGSAARAPAAASALVLAASRRLVDAGRETELRTNLYLAACGSCHYSPPAKPPAVQGSLALSKSITADDPSNFIQTVMQGVGGAGMPRPFATALTDADIALLAGYLHRTRSVHIENPVSRRGDFKSGELVAGYAGWQDYALSDGKGLTSLYPEAPHPSRAPGVLGMPGFTAYMGLLDIGRPITGETVVVAAASGAVGSVVGQIAKLKGCYVVGIARAARTSAAL